MIIVIGGLETLLPVSERPRVHQFALLGVGSSFRLTHSELLGEFLN